MLPGRPTEALQAIQQAIRMSPRGPVNTFYILGWAFSYIRSDMRSRLSRSSERLPSLPSIPLAYPLQAYNYIAEQVSTKP